MLEEERPFDKLRANGISYGRLPSLRRRRFRLVAAEVDDRAEPAFGGESLADITTVEEQPVVRADVEGLRGLLVELFFDCEQRLAGGDDRQSVVLRRVLLVRVNLGRRRVDKNNR